MGLREGQQAQVQSRAAPSPLKLSRATTSTPPPWLNSLEYHQRNQQQQQRQQRLATPLPLTLFRLLLPKTDQDPANQHQSTPRDPPQQLSALSTSRMP